MTKCTICGLPLTGDDDADEACCTDCVLRNLAGAELRPLPWVGESGPPRRTPPYELRGNALHLLPETQP
jgi:hypothetical protein